jgi:hypothetical protein
MERFAHLIEANTPKLQRWADIIVTKVLDKIPSLFAEFEANVPKALIGVEKFVDSVSGIGKEADKLLGPGGAITTLVSGIGFAFGGLKGAITANLVKGGLDPFTALIVGNIAGTAIPNALAEVFTKVVVTKAVAAFGTSIAASSAAGAAASAATTTTAGGGGLMALLGTAILPVSIVALSVAATAALTSAITAGNMTDKVGGNGVVDLFGTTAATTAGGAPFDLGALWQFITTGVQPTTSTGYTGGNVGTSYNNIYIGTGKVDTVVTDSIKRTGVPGRNR